MASGKPVINTTLDSGVPFVSLDGITGLTVPPADALSLATAINKLLDDNDLRSRYGEAARKRVYKEFKLETMVHRTCRLYAQLLESPGLMNLEGFNRKYVLLPTPWTKRLLTYRSHSPACFYRHLFGR